MKSDSTGFVTLRNARSSRGTGAREALAAYLFGSSASGARPDAQVIEDSGEPVYACAGYRRFLDPDGNPAVKPPWATLNAIGLHPRSEEWLTGDRMAGVWYQNADEATAHQQAMDVVPYGKYEAMAVSPLTSGRLNPPDICMIYATPAQMILFINGLQWTGYRKLEWGCVGESSCTDSWGRALKTGEPSLSVPCFAERRYGGVMEDELLMALPPRLLAKTIAGLDALSRNGLRYPIAPYGVNNDVRAGMGVSYPQGSR